MRVGRGGLSSFSNFPEVHMSSLESIDRWHDLDLSGFDRFSDDLGSVSQPFGDRIYVMTHLAPEFLVF